MGITSSIWYVVRLRVGLRGGRRRLGFGLCRWRSLLRGGRCSGRCYTVRWGLGLWRPCGKVFLPSPFCAARRRITDNATSIRERNQRATRGELHRKDRDVHPPSIRVHRSEQPSSFGRCLVCRGRACDASIGRKLPDRRSGYECLQGRGDESSVEECLRTGGAGWLRVRKPGSSMCACKRTARQDEITPHDVRVKACSKPLSKRGSGVRRSPRVAAMRCEHASDVEQNSLHKRDRCDVLLHVGGQNSILAQAADGDTVPTEALEPFHQTGGTPRVLVGPMPKGGSSSALKFRSDKMHDSPPEGDNASGTRALRFVIRVRNGRRPVTEELIDCRGAVEYLDLAVLAIWLSRKHPGVHGCVDVRGEIGLRERIRSTR